MNQAEMKTTARQTLNVLAMLLPVAGTVCAIVGGVPVPVTMGMAAAHALIPVADEFIMKIGTKELSLDVSGITTAQEVRDLLTGFEPFPELAFRSTAGGPEEEHA